MIDEDFMRLAIAEARAAEAAGEVPVGAIIVGPDGAVISHGHNSVIADSDAAAHCEIVAIRHAGRAIGNYRLLGCTLYCTLEPCAMCAGAIVHARIARVVFGTRDMKAGACGSVLGVLNHPSLNHTVDVAEGVLASECAEILSGFFRSRRGRSAQTTSPTDASD